MDYDDDGILDLISGSYDPGDIYLFRGLGKGVFAKVEGLKDKTGLPLVHHPKQLSEYHQLRDNSSADTDEATRARVASFGSWVAPVDWEADGDLDLLIGSFAGELFLRVNEGTRREPFYGVESIPVEADGKPLKVNGHAAPVVADWNQDGRWDLVVGSSDGAVGWFANRGTANEPSFGPYQQLVSPVSEDKFLEQTLTRDETPQHGVRAQICVTDYNGDGRLDLILGDYSDISWLREGLDDKDRAELDRLLAIQDKLMARSRQIRDQWAKDPDNEQWKQKLTALQPAWELLEKKKQRYRAEQRRASFVWLFLRNEQALTVSDSPSSSSTLSASPAVGQPAKEAKARKHSEGSDRNGPVTMNATLSPADGGENRWRLEVTLSIASGWHAYRDVPSDSTVQAMRLNLKLPEGVKKAGKLQRPPGVPALREQGQTLYSGQVTFEQMLWVEPGAAGSIDVAMDYQICNDQSCLPPSTLRKRVALPE